MVGTRVITLRGLARRNKCSDRKLLVVSTGSAEARPYATGRCGNKSVIFTWYNTEKGAGVAATEFDILRDEQERSNLLRAIASVETAIAVSTPGTRRVLENTVENAKKRITTLDQRIDQAKVEHAAEVQAQVAATAALAAKETRLSDKERETYRGFLEESYFTKSDFGKLDQFYAHSYDRLSDDGKYQMSKRIHEGIKHGEFKFADLPERVQEKDNAHCGVKSDKEAPIPPSKTKNDNSSHPTKSAETTAVRSIDLTSIDLSGLKIAESDGGLSTAALPDASGGRIARR